MGEATQQPGAHVTHSDLGSKERLSLVLVALGIKGALPMTRQIGPPLGKPHLFVHDCRELAEHVLIMGPQFLLVLQLVLLDEALIHVKGLPTRICKPPAVTAIGKSATSQRQGPLEVRLLMDRLCHPEGGWAGGFLGNS